MLKIRPFWLFQIMDDPRVGFYVENITEEYVSTYEDVSQMLIKVHKRFSYHNTLNFLVVLSMQ